MTIRINGTNTTASPGITGTDTDTGLQFGTDEVSIVTGGTDRLNIGSSGDITIADGNLVVAAGHGIDFSANANAGGMTSELLDDYEEGTWSAVLRYHTTVSDTSGTGNSSINASEARYTKIGKVVYITCTFTTAATANYVYPEIQGLPFSPQRDAVLNVYFRGALMRFNASTSADAYFYGGIYANDTTINLGSERTDATQSGWIQARETSQLCRVSGCYEAA